MSGALPGFLIKKSNYSKTYFYMFRVRNICDHPGAVRTGREGFREFFSKSQFFQRLDPLMFRARNMLCRGYRAALRALSALPRPPRAADRRPSPVCAILPPCPSPDREGHRPWPAANA
jgi:hypothetical protein